MLQSCLLSCKSYQRGLECLVLRLQVFLAHVFFYLRYGFGAYFNILPGSEWSALMLTYGFPLTIIGMALKARTLFHDYLSFIWYSLNYASYSLVPQKYVLRLFTMLQRY